MEYNFDWEYVKSGSPYVTISSFGIAFNGLSIKQLGSPNYIIVGFDENKLAIGVKGVELKDNEKTTYDFIARKNKDGWIRIGCKEFIQRLEKLTNEDFSSAKRFYTRKISDNFIVIDISTLEVVE